MVRTAPGFGYGWVLAWAFVMSFFALMAGLILQGFTDVIKAELEKRERAAALIAGSALVAGVINADKIVAGVRKTLGL